MKPFKKLGKWFFGCFNCGTGCACTTNVVCCGGVHGCTADEHPKRKKEADEQRPKREEEEEEED
jgi:hypothetical protein